MKEPYHQQHSKQPQNKAPSEDVKQQQPRQKSFVRESKPRSVSRNTVIHLRCC